MIGGLNKGKAIIFSAPSGAGKTTIVHRLLAIEKLKLAFSVSATSRARRGQEVNGEDYYFLSTEQFREKVKRHELIEWEEVYPDQLYGTLESEIERIWQNGHHVIFDLDVIGGLNLKKYFGNAALSIFVEPPSFEILESRLRGRGTEKEEKIEMRLAKASQELARSVDFDYVLLNENLEEAVENASRKIEDFIEKE